MTTKRVPYDSKQYPKPIGPEQPKTIHYDPHQYDHPIGPVRPTTSQKVVQGARNVSREVASVANDVYDAGAQARAVGHEIGQNPRIMGMRSQDGFSNQSPRQQPRGGYHRANDPVQYPDEQSDPGERIYMTICDSRGNCRQKTIKGAPRKPRQARGPSWGAGGLGSFGNDPGFL